MYGRHPKGAVLMTRTIPRSHITRLRNSSSVRISGDSSKNVFGWTNDWMYYLAFLLKVFVLSISWRLKVGRIIEYSRRCTMRSVIIIT